MRPSKRLIPLSLFSLVIAPVFSTCYYPNGTADDNYQQCNRVQGVNGMCCALDRPNSPGGPDSKGYTADICLENGLCQNIVQKMSTGQMVYTYWRTLCTSTDWSTNGCLNVCTQGEVYPGHTVPLTPCENSPGSRTWCCGQNNTACCGTSEAIILAPMLAVGLLAPTSSVASTSVSTASPSSASPATTAASVPTTAISASASQPRDSSLSTGVKVGIGIGVGVGSVVVFGSLAVLLVRWRRRLVSRRPFPFSGLGIISRGQVQEKAADGPLTRHELSGRNVVEAEGESPVVGGGNKPGAFTT
ncbi:hypothetical protein ALT_7570 [Aspergillus lentulus]|uniref:Mid2 domain-containing protein n=1 Tax=Aspergillus lentulus TaxID=293939 RepID=A0AAN4TDX2_ASPLE|nr:hypothetical protein CNMCM7927_002644 [Aspergillus lentulus]GAQ10249.1 hypothetical protein ALT_7570 [Aspergillus lentulus]GFF58591.1 hypothetical protein IFM62136_03858 [Aspergillus lentulus]GFF76277.1 hypothetical protein IFM60648_04661 [Aspergillus lentulus]GFF78674.1 hypothetical protein IFM47457_04718 [Aspergillus lentulus]